MPETVPHIHVQMYLRVLASELASLKTLDLPSSALYRAAALRHARTIRLATKDLETALRNRRKPERVKKDPASLAGSAPRPSP